MGINYGTVYLPPEQPETPPSPRSTIPFSRDLDFVDRGTILNQMHEKCSIPGSRIALVGLGGVGRKSQLAIEYCHRFRDQSPETWVLWIHASNAARFDQDCRNIADLVKIPGRKNPQANIFKLLHDWLQDKSGKWILVLDNLDDDRFLHEIPPAEKGGLTDDKRDPPGRPISAYFPKTLSGSIIITSQSRRVALRTVQDSSIISVEPMSEKYAARLFEKKFGEKATNEDVIRLTEALDFMPLAIVQAAAYIKQRFPRLSIISYVEQFRKSNRQKTRLLRYDELDHRRDSEASSSILTTWQIAFDHIQKIRPTAADLLSLMSFFDRQGIPESLLQEEKEKQDCGRFSTCDKDQAEDDSDGDDSASDSIEDTFESDLVVLRDYSLISISADETNFEIHQLVQLAIQEWLEAHGKLEHWKAQFIRKLSNRLPEAIFKNWQEYQLLFAHVESAVMHKPVAKDALENWASLLHNASLFSMIRGDFLTSQRLGEKAKVTRMKLFGPEDERTIDSFEALGEAYRFDRQWEKAEELQVKVIDTRKRVLGPEDISTLGGMSCLAFTYIHQGRWEEAEALHIQVLDTHKRAFGLKHPHTLYGMSCLAITYHSQGRLGEAEDLQRQVVNTRQQALGLELLDFAAFKDGMLNILESQDELALIFNDQDRWAEAEALQKQVLGARQLAFGSEHRDTLRTMSYLALTYRDQCLWEKAEELQQQVVASRKKTLGPENPDTLDSMTDLALTYRKQDILTKAEELQKQVLEARQRTLGQKHHDTLNAMSSLAFTYRDQCRWKEAEELQKEVVDFRQQVFGQNHSSTLASLDSLSTILNDPDRRQEGEPLKYIIIYPRRGPLKNDQRWIKVYPPADFDFHSPSKSLLSRLKEAVRSWQF
ncbi:P-loop containing nucleoside triphosphate hydrolase protein [Penicillium longicatenatum]|nr:P-loop containing nucleoside triphosphate hydrolase protein [Penicillium longicatenatum]